MVSVSGGSIVRQILLWDIFNSLDTMSSTIERFIECILSVLLYREMPIKDGSRPPRKLPDPALLVQRPGTAAAALQKRKLRTSKD